MVNSIGELFTALANRDFDRLLNTRESDWVDFKVSPYALGSAGNLERVKWELAKDVVSFANARGGVIVLGVQTAEVAQEMAEFASAVAPVRKELVNAEQYRDIVAEWSYPAIRDLSVRWYPLPADEDNGLWTIEIPAQAERDKPFIVRRMITEEGVRIAHAIGVPRRDGDRVVWARPEEMYRLLVDGQHASSPGTAPSESWRASQIERSAQHVEEALNQEGWDDAPVYILQAFPPSGPAMLPGFFSSNGIKGALKNPNSIRPRYGFNLASGTDVTESDAMLTILGGSRIALRLERDGLLTVAADGTGNFLGHALNPRRGDDNRITLNPVVLTEFTLEFFRFVYDVLAPAVGPGSWRFGAQCHRFLEPNPVCLPPYTVGEDRALAWIHQRPATRNEFAVSVDGTGDAARDAYEVLRNVYGLFGFGEEHMPFIDSGRVSEDLIRAIPRRA